jgi:hypothetical protein
LPLPKGYLEQIEINNRNYRPLTLIGNSFSPSSNFLNDTYSNSYDIIKGELEIDAILNETTFQEESPSINQQNFLNEIINSNTEMLLNKNRSRPPALKI